jgi:hypothetical protein
MWFDDSTTPLQRMQRRAIDFLLDHFLAFYAFAVTLALAGWGWEFLL